MNDFSHRSQDRVRRNSSLVDFASGSVEHVCEGRFGFVRSCAEYLDDYEDAYAVAKDISDQRWDNTCPPIALEGGSGNVAAFVRARPGDRTAPVVVHLIDWDSSPQPFEITVNPDICLGTNDCRIQLLTPASYNQKAHDWAWDTGDYRPLRKTVDSGTGPKVHVPALNPWGIILVHPAR